MNGSLRIIILLAVLVAAALAAAGGVWWASAPDRGAAPPDPAMPSPERVVIYHYWDGAFASLRDSLQLQAEAFNAGRRDVRCQPSPTVHESYKANARAMLGDAAAPEWYSWWAGWRTRDLAESGLIAILDPHWQAAGLDQRFPPGLVDMACTVDGHRRLLPLVQSFVGVFYSRAAFARAGIARPPATWDEFTSACRRLRAGGTNPVSLGAASRWPAQYWFDYLLLRTAGPAYRARLLAGAARYDDAPVRRAFALWRGLVEAGTFNANPGGSDWSEAAKLVHANGAAMTLMGSWIIDLYTRLGWKGDDDYGFFPFPAVDPGVPAATLTVVDGLVLSRSARSPAAAFAVAEFLTRPEVQLALADAAGGFAPQAAVTADHYQGIRHSIRDSVSGDLAFCYDLSTPPEVERIGLELMARFLDEPARADALLDDAAGRIAACFAARATATAAATR